MANISLRVNGKEYAGWKTATVTRGIETIAGSFDLSVSERWSPDVAPWPISEEDECVVAVGSTKLITGYVDRRSLAFGPSEHTLTLAGRDKTGDLVDCSANPLLEKWEFAGISVLKFAQQIAAPFGIRVTLQPGLTDAKLPKPPKKLRIDPGDTAFTAIENACRLAALLPVSDGLGGLVLTRAGDTHTTTEIVEGENILAASADFDASGRFRNYHVLGQHKGTDEFNGVSANSVKGTATDLTVKRSHRTVIIRPEHSVTVESAKTRAQWEATTRAARAGTVSITVQGWTQGNGVVWPINALARVRSPKLGVDGDMLITQATYSIGEDGTKTVLTLKRPDAFLPEPTIKADGGNNYWREIVKGV